MEACAARVDGPAVLPAAPARRARHHLAVRPLPRLVHGAHASGHRGGDDGRCGRRHQLVEAAAGHRHPAPPPSHRIARLPPLPHWPPRACPLSAHHGLPACPAHHCLPAFPHRCSRRSPSSSSWSASTCRPSPATPSTRACEYAASDATGSTTASSSSTLCRPPWMRCPSPSPNPNPHQAPPGLEEVLAMSGCTPMTAPCVP